MEVETTLFSAVLRAIPICTAYITVRSLEKIGDIGEETVLKGWNVLPQIKDGTVASGREMIGSPDF